MKADLRNSLIAVAVAIGFLITSVVIASSNAGVGNEELLNYENSLRATLVYSCEHEGNPLRVTVQKILKEDIKNSAHIQTSYFPNIPPHVIHLLVQKGIAAEKARLKEIAPIECAEAYPPAP